ncbi:MAG: hypothetical protein ACR2PL_09620 [Dehalococcoidia bacterium]
MMSIVVCQVEGIQPPVLTRWGFYEILAEDTVPTPMLRVRADDGAARWFPASVFARYPAEPPRAIRWQFDEPLEDEGHDTNVISLQMDDGTRRWCNVVTLKWLQRRLSDPQHAPGIYLGQTLVLASLSPEHIEATLKDLETSKELTGATTLLPADSDADEDIAGSGEQRDP